MGQNDSVGAKYSVLAGCACERFFRGAFDFFLRSEWPGVTSRRQRFFRYQAERIIAQTQAKGRGFSGYSSTECRYWHEYLCHESSCMDP